MKRLIIASMVVFTLLLTLSFAFAGEGTVVGPRPFLVQDSYQFGALKVTISSPEPVDTSKLVTGIKKDGSETAETIQSKINEKRQALYPGMEILLSVTNGDASAAQKGRAGYVTLSQYYYWWNLSHGYNQYWYTIEYAAAAACFTSVSSGTYSFYSYQGSWSYIQNVSSPFGYTSYGYPDYRGCAGVGATSYNTSDVVMYFYQ